MSNFEVGSSALDIRHSVFPMSRVRAWAEAWLPWGILGLLTAGMLGEGVSEGIQRLVQQNGAVLLLVAILVQYAPRAIDAQRAQAAAMADLAASVRDLPRQQDLRLEKLQIGIQMVLDRLDRMECAHGES
jgi:hypothetical protein